MTRMIERTRRDARTERAQQRRLRAGVLRLGGYLGWDTQRVVRFSEATTGRSWRRCGRTELIQVLGAFAELAARVRAATRTRPVDGIAAAARAEQPGSPGADIPAQD
jgi:hypothetical protein